MSVSAPAKLSVVLCAAVIAVTAASVVMYTPSHPFEVPDGLPEFTVSGETDLEGNFYLSFVYTKNIIMLDGKGNIVWAKHVDQGDYQNTGMWDFKKHVIDGKTYYSYHEQDGANDRYGLAGYAPGERVIMDSMFREIKRITFEKSDVTEKGDPLDGHDFLMIDLDHYILSGYRKATVHNVPGYSESTLIYSYLQEVKDGEVVWDWKSIDYPEIYSMVCTEANPTANDFGNVEDPAPDYVHFNAMRLNDDGDLVCSFRHLDTILCLDRTKSTDQIKWKLSGPEDMFGLTEDQKTSAQHYVTVDGDTITVFDNHNLTGETKVWSVRIDTANMTSSDFRGYRIDGKTTSACGSAQHLYGDTYAIGWGKTENDAVTMSVYDFAAQKELISVTLANPNNFAYRCVYYE